jgi:hypothetical protein
MISSAQIDPLFFCHHNHTLEWGRMRVPYYIMLMCKCLQILFARVTRSAFVILKNNIGFCGTLTKLHTVDCIPMVRFRVYCCSQLFISFFHAYILIKYNRCSVKFARFYSFYYRGSEDMVWEAFLFEIAIFLAIVWQKNKLFAGKCFLAFF